MTGFNFDEQAVRRIVRSVLNDEKRQKNKVESPRPFNRRQFGDAENYRAIRGQSVGFQTGTVVYIDNVVVLAGGLDPSSGSALVQVPVNNFIFVPLGTPRELTDDQWIDAFYSPASSMLGTGTAGTAIDWETLESGTSSSGSALPPLRAFELTANKTLISTTATAKWLDLDGNMIGEDVTLYDPEHRFSGRIADDLYSGSPGFRGYAIERFDLAFEDLARYEIVEMDSLYEFIKGEIVKVSNYPDFPVASTTEARFIEEINQLGYDRHSPALSTGTIDVQVGYIQDTDIFANSVIPEPDYSAGAESAKPVLMQLTNPDSSPPTYRVYEARVVDTAGTGGGTGGYCIAVDGDQRHYDAITGSAGQPAVDRDLAQQQFWVHFGDADSRDDALWKTGSGYSSSGTAQFLMNDTGTWQWVRRDTALNPNSAGGDGSTVVNSITGLLLEGSTLKITYDIVRVFGAVSGAGNFTVPTGTCT